MVSAILRTMISSKDRYMSTTTALAITVSGTKTRTAKMDTVLNTISVVPSTKDTGRMMSTMDMEYLFMKMEMSMMETLWKEWPVDMVYLLR
jgi:hypothetical protein